MSLEHYDTGDFLSFEKRDPTEGAYWADQEEDRREQGIDGGELFDLFTAHGTTRAEIASMDLATATRHVHEMRAEDVDDLGLTDEEIARAILKYAREEA